MAIKFTPIERKPLEKAVVKALVKAVDPTPHDTPETVERKARAARIIMDKAAGLQEAIAEIEKPGAKKVKTSIRLDADVYAWLNEGEGHWQSKLNAALRRLMEASR